MQKWKKRNAEKKKCKRESVQFRAWEGGLKKGRAGGRD